MVDNTGYDWLNEYSLLCHFTNRDKEKTEINKKYPIELSKIKPVYEIPGEVTIIIEEKDIKFLGNKSYYEFKDGNIIKLNI